MILIFNKTVKYPRAASDRRNTSRGEGTDHIREAVHDLGQGGKIDIVESLDPDRFPDLLNGIHLRGVRREEEKHNVIRNDKGLGFVPGRTIAAKQDDIIGKLLGELLQK